MYEKTEMETHESKSATIADPTSTDGQIVETPELEKFEYKVNGETFFSEQQIIDATIILQTAYKGKAIGKDPDKYGFRLNVANSQKTFVAGDDVDLRKFSSFRAFPDSGAPFSAENISDMSENTELMFKELEYLDYKPERFSSSMRHCQGEGVKFEYVIKDGSRSGEKVMIGLVVSDSRGTWPEVAPHWILVSPIDTVLEEQVKANRNGQQGSAERYTDKNGVEWMAISAPVADFWDQIEPPDSKSIRTYLERHMRRIWGAR